MIQPAAPTKIKQLPNEWMFIKVANVSSKQDITILLKHGADTPASLNVFFNVTDNQCYPRSNRWDQHICLLSNL